jgi:hypothetical protein
LIKGEVVSPDMMQKGVNHVPALVHTRELPTKITDIINGVTEPAASCVFFHYPTDLEISTKSNKIHQSLIRNVGKQDQVAAYN